jgi:hypothetical protein
VYGIFVDPPREVLGEPVTVRTLGGDFITPRVTACMGDLSGTTPATAEQLQRRDFFVRASQIPQSFIVTDMFFARSAWARCSIAGRTASTHGAMPASTTRHRT